MKRVPPSTAIFAAIMIATGIWGLAEWAFVGLWAPGIQPAALRLPMIFVCSVVSLIAGAGLLWSRHALSSALLLSLFLILWIIWCKAPALSHSPTELASWESLGETAVLISAAWALSIPPKRQRRDRPRTQHALAGPRSLFGFALMAFGASHLAYVTLTASLIPSWLPWHVEWVYLTATTYVAAGAALALGRFSTAAATLSAVQMTLFSLLVWLPKIAAGDTSADTLNETDVSFALAAGAFVIAAALKRAQLGPSKEHRGLYAAQAEPA